MAKDGEKSGELWSTRLVRLLFRECLGHVSKRSIFDYLDAKQVREFEVFFRVHLVVARWRVRPGTSGYHLENRGVGDCCWLSDRTAAAAESVPQPSGPGAR